MIDLVIGGNKFLIKNTGDYPREVGMKKTGELVHSAIGPDGSVEYFWNITDQTLTRIASVSGGEFKIANEMVILKDKEHWLLLLTGFYIIGSDRVHNHFSAQFLGHSQKEACERLVQELVGPLNSAKFRIDAGALETSLRQYLQ